MGTVRTHRMPPCETSRRRVRKSRRGRSIRWHCYYVPGSSRSALLSINGPCPGFGAAIRVRLDTRLRPLTLPILGRALDRSNRGSIALPAVERSTRGPLAGEIFPIGLVFALFAFGELVGTRLAQNPPPRAYQDGTDKRQVEENLSIPYRR
jgi:hypothetical protein